MLLGLLRNVDKPKLAEENNHKNTEELTIPHPNLKFWFLLFIRVFVFFFYYHMQDVKIF